MGIAQHSEILSLERALEVVHRIEDTWENISNLVRTLSNDGFSRDSITQLKLQAVAFQALSKHIKDNDLTPSSAEILAISSRLNQDIPKLPSPHTLGSKEPLSPESLKSFGEIVDQLDVRLTFSKPNFLEITRAIHSALETKLTVLTGGAPEKRERAPRGSRSTTKPIKLTEEVLKPEATKYIGEFLAPPEFLERIPLTKRSGTVVWALTQRNINSVEELIGFLKMSESGIRGVISNLCLRYGIANTSENFGKLKELAKEEFASV